MIAVASALLSAASALLSAVGTVLLCSYQLTGYFTERWHLLYIHSRALQSAGWSPVKNIVKNQ